MIHRISWRVASEDALDFWAGAARRRGREAERDGRPRRFADPEGLGHELTVVETARRAAHRRPPEIRPSVALQGFDGVRAYSARPDASRGLLEDALGFERADDGLGGPRGAARGSLYAYDPPPAAGGSPGRRHGASRRVGSTMEDHERVARARRRSAGVRPTRRDRPLLVPVDLLPRAERRAVRDRHARARASRRTRPRSTSASRSSCRPRSSTCASRSSRC